MDVQTQFSSFIPYPCFVSQKIPDRVLHVHNNREISNIFPIQTVYAPRLTMIKKMQFMTNLFHDIPGNIAIISKSHLSIVGTPRFKYTLRLTLRFSVLTKD